MYERLTPEDKKRLVTGSGMWHTRDLGGKLPSIHLSDGPHGLRKQTEDMKQNNNAVIATCFPTASAIASSWDTELAARVARAIAREALAEKVSVVLGPGTNIKRSPLCGRNFEYFSEDPYLAGMMATAYINAMQSKGVGTSLKHFAANNQETLRMTSDSIVDERALREIYLAAFEMAVRDARPATIMASYNSINGEHACECRKLLTDILRTEWGFEGLVMSDWGACVDLPACVAAGMDLEMPDSGDLHAGDMDRAVEEGTLSIKALNQATKRIVELIEKYYPKDTPGRVEKSKKALLEENHEKAVQTETECAVLLKNEGVLPLDKPEKVLVVGDMARVIRFQGGGSSHINTASCKDVCQAFEAAGISVEFAKGYNEGSLEPSIKLEEEAIESIKRAKEEGLPIIFCGGLPDIAEGEGYDRKTYSMPKNQEQLLERALEIDKDLIFVSFNGSPYDCKTADRAGAFLMMYLGGEAVAEACVKLLTGEANPCGHLAETFPCSIEDCAATPYFATASKNVEYRESLYVGYRYYDTFGVDVRYPFGFGLSYTTFEYFDLKVQKTDSGVRVTFTAKNTGDVTGKTVPQIYVKNPETRAMRPKRELRGFAKFYLCPGEEKEITIDLSDKAFSIYSERQGAWTQIKGDYEIQLGTSIRDIVLTAPISITEGMDISEEEADNWAGYIPEAGKKLAPTDEEFRKRLGFEVPDYDDVRPGTLTLKHSLDDLSKYSLAAKLFKGIARKMVYGMYKGKRHDDPEVMMIVECVIYGSLDSVLCQGGGAVDRWVGDALVLSANGHKWQAFLKIFKH